MKRSTAEATSCWGVYREREHSPGREADDAGILEAAGRRIAEEGFSVAYVQPDALGGRARTPPSLVFAMCEGQPALERLRVSESRGVTVVNSSISIVNTHRERTIALLQGRRVPMPESRVLDCLSPLPRGQEEDRLFSACWVKQATEHKTREGDVIFAGDRASVQDALDRLRNRGLSSAVVQGHVEGDLVKFYGVSDAGTPRAAWFRWFYPKEHPAAGHAFDAAELGEIACRAAQALELDVWGGDAIVTRDGEIFVIDLNAWPSFALFSRGSGGPHRRTPDGAAAAAYARGRMTARERGGGDARAGELRRADARGSDARDRDARTAARAPHRAGRTARGVQPGLRAHRRRWRDPSRPRGHRRAGFSSRRRRGGGASGPDRAAVGPRRREPAMAREPSRGPRRAGLHRLGAGAIVQTDEPALLARTLARQTLLPSIVSEWAAELPAGLPVADVATPLEATTASELAAGETLLLKSLVKKEDGILTKHISRKISLAVTRRVAGTRIVPNAMTLMTAALELAAAWSFASPALGRQIVGGLLFLLHSILDGCDGELARLKFRESRFGGTLDFWSDNVVHVAVFSAFAIAWSRASGADVAAPARHPGRLGQRSWARDSSTPTRCGLAERSPDRS